MLSNHSYSLPSSPAPFASSSTSPLSTLSARNRVTQGSLSTFSFPPPPQATNPILSSPIRFTDSTTKPQFNIGGPPLLPAQLLPSTQQAQKPQLGPNYNIQLPPSNLPATTVPSPFSSILAPTTPSNPTWGSNNTGQKQGRDAWGDFDPLG